MREGLREVTIQFYPDSRLGSLPISVYTIIAVLISSYLRLSKATATHRSAANPCSQAHARSPQSGAGDTSAQLSTG